MWIKIEEGTLEYIVLSARAVTSHHCIEVEMDWVAPDVVPLDDLNLTTCVFNYQ